MLRREFELSTAGMRAPTMIRIRQDLGRRGYRFEKNVVYQTECLLFFCQCSKNGNIWRDNLFEKDAPARAKLAAIANEVRLESPYRQKLITEP